MTKDWIEVIMEDQSKLYIETTGSMPTGGEDSLMVPAASEGSIIKKTEELLEKSFAQIKRFSDGIATSIKNSDISPREFELEFGVKFAADAGIVISSISSEANVTIRMKWTTDGEC